MPPRESRSGAPIARSPAWFSMPGCGFLRGLQRDHRGGGWANAFFKLGSVGWDESSNLTLDFPSVLLGLDDLFQPTSKTAMALGLAVIALDPWPVFWCNAARFNRGGGLPRCA